MTEQEFWARGQRTLTGCLFWTGGRDRDGYGKARLEGHVDRRVSRLSWTLLHKRPIPTGFIVMHTCDERLCFEPAHLALGTNHANVLDMDQKGRGRRQAPVLFGDANGARKHPETRQGERNGRAKLSELQARAVRVLMKSGQLSQQQVAEAFGISKAQAKRIASGQQWASLEAIPQET